MPNIRVFLKTSEDAVAIIRKSEKIKALRETKAMEIFLRGADGSQESYYYKETDGQIFKDLRAMMLAVEARAVDALVKEFMSKYNLTELELGENECCGN